MCVVLEIGSFKYRGNEFENGYCNSQKDRGVPKILADFLLNIVDRRSILL